MMMNMRSRDMLISAITLFIMLLYSFGLIWAIVHDDGLAEMARAGGLMAVVRERGLLATLWDSLMLRYIPLTVLGIIVLLVVIWVLNLHTEDGQP